MKQAVVIAVLCALLLSAGAAARSDSNPTVFAAASLTDAFPKIDRSPTYSFAGSAQTLLM